ncbi:MAG: hypothetical protein U9Q12_02705 [Patescibacteria group bacterium]|nr:hypothetical protein [Patescibacteria group bacterium]
MNEKLIQRATLSKGIGALIGIFVFIFLPYMWPDVTMHMRIGMFVGFTFLGGTIAVTGIFTQIPALNLKLTAAIRGALIGGSFMLVLVLISYDLLVMYMRTATVFQGLSPYWMIVDGIIIGAIIDIIATKKVGEGKELCQ